MAAFRKHLQTYVPRIFQFHGLSPEQGAEEVRKFEDNAAFLAVAERLMKRTGFVQDIAIVEDSLRFSLGHAQLSEEIEFLKKQGIHRIAKANPSFSLTGAQSDLVEAVARNQVLAGSQAQ